MSLELISLITGYTYTICYFLCNFSQLVKIYKLKNAEGLSLDFQILNNIGFICLSISYSYYYWFSTNNLIKLNDVIFALSVLYVTMINLCLCYFYPLGNNKISKTGYVGLINLPSMILIYLFLGMIFKNQISVFEYIGTSKIIASSFKYIVQISFNFRRKLTIGWSVKNSLFDMLGAFLSIIQLLIDYFIDGKKENPLKGSKFLLGMVTIVFNVILFLQIYVFYRKNNKKALEKELLD